MALRAIIFCVDGTLANTERDGHRPAFNAAFAEMGLPWHWGESFYGTLLVKGEKALRLNQGFEPDLFAMRTSLPLITIENELRRAEQQGLIERQPQRIAPTLHGQRFLNRLLEMFLA